MEKSRGGIGGKIIWWLISGISLSTMAIFLLVIITVFMVIGAVLANESSKPGSSASLPPEVEQYRVTVSAMCAKYDVEEYVNLVLAIMAQESGGLGLDPMQASESPFNKLYPQSPGGITDPDYSIECGVQMFKLVKESADVQSPEDMDNIKLALQGYNFGEGYIPWARSHADGGYTPENAAEFSKMKAAALGWSSYGDVDYVPHVLRYYFAAGDGEGGSGTGQFTWPVPGYNTLSRGFILNSDGSVYHRGLDIPAPNGANIVAADGGVVAVAIHGHYSYGNYIQINHGNGYSTVYAHCIGLNASLGQHVSKGEVIAFIGSTGNSSGPHLHFEVSYNGALLDPLTVL